MYSISYQQQKDIYRTDFFLFTSLMECAMTNPQIASELNSNGMTGAVLIEIVGLKNSECSPFPCNEDRSCGLSGCFPSGTLTMAFEELKKILAAEYGNRVEVKLTLIDKETPDYIRTIIESEYPPLPMVLVNGRITPIGRISLERIKKEIEKEL
jgi:hypothetical protein